MAAKTLHICFLQDSLYDPSGGTWTGAHLQCYLLASEFKKSGFQVSFVIASSNSITIPNIYDGMAVDVIYVNSRFPYRKWNSISQVIDKYSPDYVYTRGRA